MICEKNGILGSPVNLHRDSRLRFILGVRLSLKPRLRLDRLDLERLSRDSLRLGFRPAAFRPESRLSLSRGSDFGSASAAALALLRRKNPKKNLRHLNSNISAPYQQIYASIITYESFYFIFSDIEVLVDRGKSFRNYHYSS